ncbi:MAG: septum formation initiator family protein [Treponema sp.]|nr:septum formation initiator family protein [Treponema sp.]MCL2272266.1 septum formation initiator family protein [Treponema sp.]
MRISKYLFSVWTAVAIYAVLSFFGGRGGYSSYNYLLAEKERQEANLKDLININENLETINNNILYDHDTMLVYAHQMGYGYEDEKFIRIVGLGKLKNIPAAAGTVYFHQKPEFINDITIKIIAFCAGLLVFFFILIMELIESRTC